MKTPRSPYRVTVTLTFSPWIFAPLIAAYYCYGFAVRVWERNAPFFHDDAYIMLRYVRNLLDGKGFVWNEGERVQGYTSFLHAILVALLGYLGIDLEKAAQGLALACYLSLVAVVAAAQGLRRMSGRSHPLDALPVLLVAGTVPLIVWSRGGLEGTLFALLTTTGALALLGALETSDRRARLLTSGFFFTLCVLTRPDGVAFVAASAAAIVLLTRERLRNLAQFLLPAVVVLLPYLLWSYWYYGDIVPNTYYAKASDFNWERVMSGVQYARDYAVQPPFVAFGLLLLPPALLLRPAARGPLAYLALLIAAYVTVIILVGGDHMHAFRFFLPVTPLLAYAVYLAAASMFPAGWGLPYAVLYLALLWPISLQWNSWQLNAVFGDAAARIGRPVGMYIDRVWPAGSLVALNTAGSTPYFAPKHRFIDMLGLNDRHIARRPVSAARAPRQRTLPGHWKGDGAYVLARDPDFIIVGPADGRPIESPWFLSDLEMGEDPRFRQRYEYLEVNLATPELFQKTVTFRFYRRKPDVPGDPELKALAERVNK